MFGGSLRTLFVGNNMHLKFLIIVLTTILLKGCGGGEEPSSRSPSSSNDVTKDKAPAPPTGVQAAAVDPLYEQSWHLNNTGQRSFSSTGGVIGRDINVTEVYQSGIFGSQVKLAVSDNGVEISHPDLWFNHLSGQSRDYSGAPSSWLSDPYPLTSSSADAHGTSVAGIISATRNNGHGTHGVAPASGFAGFLFVGAPYSESRLIDQAQGDFDIFNYSYGRATCRFSILPDAYIAQLKYGVENQRGGKGSLYVKAAGNEYVGLRSDCNSNLEDEYFGNANLEHDQSTPYLINVAALDARGFAASYSSPGSSLWISAPGGEYGSSSPAIISTDLQGCSRGVSRSTSSVNDFDKGENDLNENCDYTSSMNGTSSSAPVVSGVIALMLQANPDLTWREVKHILAATAKKVDATAKNTPHPYQGAYNLAGHVYQYGWLTNAAGYNFHNWYGFGGVDAQKAVEAAINYQSKLGAFQERQISSGEINVAIPDNDASGASHSMNMNEEFIIEAVQLRVSVEHGYASDLGIELESPSGMKSRLLNINSGIVEMDLQDSLMLTNAFYGEQAQGEWTIRLWDGALEDQGELTNWKLTFFGYYANQMNEKSAIAPASSGSSLLGLQSTSAQPTVLSRSLSQDHSSKTSEETSLKDISRNSRGPLGISSSSSQAKIQMNSFTDNVPLSELMSWPELKNHRVLSVYEVKKQVMAISEDDKSITLHLFEDDQLSTQKNFDKGDLLFQKAIFQHELSSHLLSFLTKSGDLEWWQIDESFNLVKATQKLQMKNPKAVVHLISTKNKAVAMVEDRDFVHPLIFEGVKSVKRLTPKPIVDAKVAAFFSLNDQAHLWLSYERKMEKWVLSDNETWQLESTQEMNHQVHKLLGSDRVVSAGLIAGEGLEKELGTYDIFLRYPEKEKVIRQAGDEQIVWQKVLSDGSLIIFGHTNGSFSQTNFGEWDLFGIHFDKNADELQRWHWGREQKTIASSAQQKLLHVELKELAEGRLVRLWYSHDQELKVMKFYLDDVSQESQL